mmetsp:Transcript_1019/g.2207  ORF Transcript_1019/g.2207 Transcript_1019/m.2207 type:complete len:85 (+) Transcript_1019:213-467(+)
MHNAFALKRFCVISLEVAHHFNIIEYIRLLTSRLRIGNDVSQSRLMPTTTLLFQNLKKTNYLALHVPRPPMPKGFDDHGWLIGS